MSSSPSTDRRSIRRKGSASASRRSRSARTVSLKVRRAGKEMIVPVKAIAAPETRDRDAIRVGGRTPLTGALVANLSPAVAEELSMSVRTRQASWSRMSTSRRWPPRRSAFLKGDIILPSTISDRNVARRGAATRERTSYWRITLNRGGQVITSCSAGRRPPHDARSGLVAWGTSGAGDDAQHHRADENTMNTAYPGIDGRAFRERHDELHPEIVRGLMRCSRRHDARTDHRRGRGRTTSRPSPRCSA